MRVRSVLLGRELGCLCVWLKSAEGDVIVHFTVVCVVTWPLSGGEAGVDLVLIQTLMLLICKFKLVSMRTT